MSYVVTVSQMERLEAALRKVQSGVGARYLLLMRAYHQTAELASPLATRLRITPESKLVAMSPLSFSDEEIDLLTTLASTTGRRSPDGSIPAQMLEGSPMPPIVKKPRVVLLFRSGAATTARSLSEIVEQLQAENKQLQAQMKRERDQYIFNLNQAESEKVMLSRMLAEARWELARRDTRDALAAAESPSPSIH